MASSDARGLPAVYAPSSAERSPSVSHVGSLYDASPVANSTGAPASSIAGSLGDGCDEGDGWGDADEVADAIGIADGAEEADADADDTGAPFVARAPT